MLLVEAKLLREGTASGLALNFHKAFMTAFSNKSQGLPTAHLYYSLSLSFALVYYHSTLQKSKSTTSAQTNSVLNGSHSKVVVVVIVCL